MNIKIEIGKHKYKDAISRFTKSWRLTCDNVVIDEVPDRLGKEFAVRLLTYFLDNIKNALADDDWVFDNKKRADEWLEFHEERLGVKFKKNSKLEIIEPNGIDLPLCDHLEECVKDAHWHKHKYCS